MTGPAHTVTNTWEADRDILDTKTNTETVGSTIVSKFDYTVNNIGQRSGVATTGGAFAASSGWTWGYDALGQVSSAAHASNTSLNQGYDYDDIGNRIQSSVGLSSPAVTSYTANMLNQYSGITGALAPAVNPSYDADGNQLAGAAGQALGQTFEWDGESRLKVVKDSLGNVLVAYAYDAQSRRIRRTTSTGSTLYVYDAWNCVGEHTVPSASTTATLSRTLTWGLDLSGSLQGAGGVCGLLNLVDVSSSTVAYSTYDGNGNVSEYLSTTGAVVAHFEYDAFGKTVVTTGTSTGLDVRFSTKPQDDVTGWYYYGYRYYGAELGRWLNRDPIGERGGLNLYVMVGNDPVNWVDYLGLADLPPDWTSSKPPWGGGPNSRGNCWRYVCNSPAEKPDDHSPNPPGYDPSLPIGNRCSKLIESLKREKGAYDLGKGPCFCSPEDRIISVQLSDEKTPKDPWGKPAGSPQKDYHFEYAPHYGLIGPWMDKPGYRPQKPSDGKGDNDDGKNDGYKECGKLCLPKGTQP